MKQALDKFIVVAKTCGPENHATPGQGDLLTSSGPGRSKHASMQAI